MDYKLGSMNVGYLFDYDMKTWEVTGYNTYDYSGFETKEWVLALFTVGDVYASLCKRGAYALFSAQRRSRAPLWL